MRTFRRFYSLRVLLSAAIIVYFLLLLLTFGIKRVILNPHFLLEHGDLNLGSYFESLVVAKQQQHLRKAVPGLNRLSLRGWEDDSRRGSGDKRRALPTVYQKGNATIGLKEDNKSAQRKREVDVFGLEANNAGRPADLPPSLKLDELTFKKDVRYKPSKCPKTVSTLTKYSRWFRERYQPDIKLFLEQSDISSSQDYYNLLHFRLPFGYRFSNKSKLNTILKHPNFTNAPLYAEGRPSKCITCAVIGSGGSLNGSGAGREIDSHDYVFRLNRAISVGRIAEDVGHKTSFYTFFPESMHIQDVEDENVTFFYAMFKSYDVDYAINLLSDKSPPRYVSRGKLYILRKPNIDKSRLKIIHPDFFRYVFTRYLDSKSVRPTTGAIVVFLALHLCDEVTIYGFGYDHRFTLHYYDKTFKSHDDKSTALHDVDNERELWQKLHSEGVLRLFKRDL